MNTFASPKSAKSQFIDAIWQDPWVFMACGFGAGALPFIPGTFGSLVAVLILYMLAGVPVWAYVIAVIAVSVIAYFLCRYVLAHFDLDDPGEACIDEFPGLLATFIAVPLHWHYVVIGFVLFRFFDMLKPGPIGWLDKNIHGGFGMVLDDVVAGSVSCIILHILMIWII